MTFDAGVTSGEIDAVRRFNRFYTRQIGLLEEGLLSSEFSLTEVRVLYELAHRSRPSAAELCRELGLDAGYLSRLLKKFETRGFLSRTPSREDARQSVLALTAAGRRAFEPLDRASQAQVAAMLAPLTADERRALVQAMEGIRRALGGGAESAVAYLLRPPQSGDFGWIIHRQGILYAREYGWDETYEALVAEILGRFIREFDPQRERAWIAEREGEVVGSVFLVRDGDEVARLRLLYVEPSARGLGIGARLVDECVRFARLKEYRTLTLWTNDVLTAARRLYQAAGFRLVREEPHRSFGRDLVGQHWELTLD